jgi:TonB-linked SusC/RagA family outer membrane protein
MKTGFLLVFILALSLLSGMAQTRLLTGTVSSSEDGLPIPGVSVSVKGTTTGTITDMNGIYTITVPESARMLVFSFVGMQAQDVPISSASKIDVVLKPDVIGVEEVVVTAMGIRREKKSLGYAVQEVNGDELSRAGNPNLSNALQGKVAGVQVKQASGMPGASSMVTVRGASSLTGNNQPLYVIDGMPVENTSMFNVDVASADRTNRAVDINPNDIESINVLKGAAASALYGLRASNGVVVITTKSGMGSGQEYKKYRVSLNSSWTFDEPTVLPDLQSTYAQGDRGIFNPNSSMSWGPKISQLGEYTNQQGQKETARVYDNVSPLFVTGINANNAVDLSYASDIGSFNTGIAYTDQSGIINPSAMDRWNAKFNGIFKVGSDLKVGASANYSQTHVVKIPAGSNLSNPLFTTYFAPRTYDLWGKPYKTADDPYKQYHYRSNMDNPRWSAEYNDLQEETKRVFGNMFFDYSPVKWMNLTYRLGIDNFVTDGKDKYELGSGDTGGRSTVIPSGGRIEDFMYRQNQWNSNLSITFNKEIAPDLKASLALGNEIYDIRSRHLQVTGSGITIGGFSNMSNTVSQAVLEEVFKERVFGTYYNLSFSFKDMLFLNTTGRNDVVSNMPSNNRSFFYPSVSAGFIFTELDALKENKILPYGKLRVSFAQVGQAGPKYATKTVYIKGGSANSGGFLDDGIEFPFGGYPAFTLDDDLKSSNLKPQNTMTYEVGADLKFVQNRIGLDYTYYYIDATDQIFFVPMAKSTGFDRELKNAGEVTTRGHEFVLTLKPVKTKDFDWTITTNFSKYKNEVVSLVEGADRIQAGFQNFEAVGAFAYVGSAFPVIWGSKFQRDEATGKIVVDSDSGSPTYGMPLTAPETGPIADVNPDFEIGFLNSFRYKNFTLSASIDWRQGGHMYSGLNYLGKLYGMLKETEDRESNHILDAMKGHLDEDGNVVIDGVNDIQIQKGRTYWNNVIANITEANTYETTFIRLREVTLNWDLPKAWLKPVNISNLSLYAMGRNLLMITDYPNFDPESSTSTGNGTGAFEYVSLPNTKSVGFGVKITF